MKVLKRSALLATLAALQACSTHTASTTAVEPIKASLDKPETVQPQTFVLRGEVVIGHEVSSITPCGSNKQFWLALDSLPLSPAQHLVKTPYQPLYGEVIGHLVTPSHHGFDSDFEARFIVDQINLLTAENPNRCHLPAKATGMYGTEPNWSARFQGSKLIFQRMGFNAQALTITDSQISSDQRHYILEDGELQLEAKNCSDGMSDSLFGWQAQVTLVNETYKGCATLSNQDATAGWSGIYNAKSTDNSGFNVQVELFPDHTAITQYDYNNGEPAIVEKGYWQQLNADQVQVVMTHHQRQFLRSERIFTREGNQLTATQEKVGDVLYPIANGGLTLFSVDSMGQ